MNFIKKRLQHRCFPMKLLRTSFFTELLWWLLLGIAAFENKTLMRLVLLTRSLVLSERKPRIIFLSFHGVALVIFIL